MPGQPGAAGAGGAGGAGGSAGGMPGQPGAAGAQANPFGGMNPAMMQAMMGGGAMGGGFG